MKYIDAKEHFKDTVDFRRRMEYLETTKQIKEWHYTNFTGAKITTLDGKEKIYILNEYEPTEDEY